MHRLTPLVQRLGHQAWFAALARRLVWLDRRTQRWTKGRWSPIGPLGLPTLLITTVGRRSGQPRVQPLLYVRDGADYVVVGSNWGQQHHPAWTANLLAAPDATITVAGTDVTVRGRLVEGADRAMLWAKLRAIWPAYQTYERRAASRDIRLFRLTPR